MIDRYGDAGIEFIGLDDRRPKDKFGIAAGYAHVSGRAVALDRDYQLANGIAWPLRSSETLLTTVYQYEVRPGSRFSRTTSSSIAPEAGRPIH